MTKKTAMKYAQLFRDQGFNAGIRNCEFIPGVKVSIKCSMPLLMEGISTTLYCISSKDCREILRDITVGKVTLPEGR